jgi:hypothetical protein
MDQPKRGRMFHVGVETAPAKKLAPQGGCADRTAFLRYDFAGLCPMAHGSHHVSADAELGDRVVAENDIAPGVIRCIPNSVNGLFQPPIAQRERLVS